MRDRRESVFHIVIPIDIRNVLWYTLPMSKVIVAKLDEKTLKELDKLAEGTTRSEIVREAVRQYICTRKMEQRRHEVKEYNRSTNEREFMRQLAESDMPEAAQLLDQVEGDE